MIAFNLFLRPTLAIFGLILSYSVFSASIWFVNATFKLGARGVMTDGNSALGWLVAILIMTYLHYQLAIRSFQLINQIPDRVARWFGQGGEQLNEDTDSNRTTALFVGGAEHRMREMGAGAVAGRKGAEKAMDASGKGATPGPGATSGESSKATPEKT